MRAQNLPDRERALSERVADQAAVISRRQLYALGFTQWEITAQIRARRWQRVSDQVICVHTGPLGDESLSWAAVFQGGPRAHLDGVSALIASGLKRFEAERIRVSVPRGARVRRTKVFDIRQTRRWSSDDVISSGVPRTVPAVAAVRGALWAKSDRQAALILSMAVQQGLASPNSLAEAALLVKRDRRRRFLQAVVLDLLGGARALGEIDVARECRRRGLPEPSRQVLRRDGAHRYYLDLYWDEWDVALEVDGIHHTWAENVVGDALRQNSVAIRSTTVLRLPLLGLRTRPDEFFGQLEEALRSAGWRSRAA
ncbi:very-short-patch-repair endonuclease [Marmoricola sp. URHA0025 HA25]